MTQRNISSPRKMLFTALCVALAAPLMAHAADAPAAATNDRATPAARQQAQRDWSDRRMGKDAQAQRNELKNALKTGQTPAEVRQALQSMGYVVTAVNDSDKQRIEYEVVKGHNSHEVQLNLDDARQRVTEVEVSPNLWRASTTKDALAGRKVAQPYRGAESSDRTYMKSWNDEKSALEQALPTGQPKAFYKTKLAQLGYQVTSTNDADRDHLEYEVVKGRNSYEVQLSVDAGSGKVDKVDVTTNMWESEATERALDRAAR